MNVGLSLKKLINIVLRHIHISLDLNLQTLLTLDKIILSTSTGLYSKHRTLKKYVLSKYIVINISFLANVRYPTTKIIFLN